MEANQTAIARYTRDNNRPARKSVPRQKVQGALCLVAMVPGCVLYVSAVSCGRVASVATTGSTTSPSYRCTSGTRKLPQRSSLSPYVIISTAGWKKHKAQHHHPRSLAPRPRTPASESDAGSAWYNTPPRRERTRPLQARRSDTDTQACLYQQKSRQQAWAGDQKHLGVWRGRRWS